MAESCFAVFLCLKISSLKIMATEMWFRYIRFLNVCNIIMSNCMKKIYMSLRHYMYHLSICLSWINVTFSIISAKKWKDITMQTPNIHLNHWWAPMSLTARILSHAEHAWKRNRMPKGIFILLLKLKTFQSQVLSLPECLWESIIIFVTCLLKVLWWWKL